jgi:hypothetical protein
MPLLFCWCRKPEFNLAVIDYVKSDIESVCHNRILHIAQVKEQKTTDKTNSSQQITGRAKPQIKTDKNFSVHQHEIPLAKQISQMKTVKNILSQQPRYHWQLQATSGDHQHSYFWITQDTLHTTVQSVFITSYTIRLQQGRQQQTYLIK